MIDYRPHNAPIPPGKRGWLQRLGRPPGSIDPDIQDHEASVRTWTAILILSILILSCILIAAFVGNSPR